MSWSQEDQKQLDELQQRKQDHLNSLRKKVDDAVELFFHHNMMRSDIAGALIDNADEVTEALQPFLSKNRKRNGIDA